jgi:hypothetical protein
MAIVNINLLSSDDLVKLIASVKTSGSRFDALVQKAAIQCVAQSIVHSNVTPANDLFNALPKGSRRDSLVAWFERHGNLAWMKAERKLAFFKAVEASAWTPEYAVEVGGNMWTTGTKAPEIKSTYDLEDEFGKVFDRLGKVMSDSTKTIEHRDLYAKLKAVYNNHIVGHVPANEPEVEAAA